MARFIARLTQPGTTSETYGRREPVPDATPLYLTSKPAARLSRSSAREEARRRLGDEFILISVPSFTDPVVLRNAERNTEVIDTFHPESPTVPGDGSGFDQDSRYQVNCNRHSTYIVCNSVSNARSLARYPNNFCEECD